MRTRTKVMAGSACLALALLASAVALVVHDRVTKGWRTGYAQWDRPDYFSDAAAERRLTFNQIMLEDSWSDSDVDAIISLYNDAQKIETERELPGAMVGGVEPWVEVQLLQREVMNSVGERLRHGPEIKPDARDRLQQWLVGLLDPATDPALRSVAANNLIYGKCAETPAVRDLLSRIAREDTDRELAHLIVRKLDHEDLVQQWIQDGKHHEVQRR